ncbi:MAG: DUF4266 domain-containing protein [Sandaracinus sp.]|nr:DUF4266 domain-containing protein [Sandaracinus sp.]MCB9618286.1 DUF4266 domain-containing protein [Sandaracinus sp.]MCB9634398.1 DUF4266 domain-containing protein [Sandaracinus sp.]
MTSLSFRLSRVVLAAGLLTGLVVGVGCVHVAPYEREDLARPGMDTERESAEMGFQAHVHDSREGATGGAGSTGGGCGCN